MTDIDGPAAPEEEESSIGWPRAIATGLAILVATVAGAIFGANAILTKSLALTRTARAWLASALFFAVLIIVAAALRWLQQRKLI